MGAWFSSFLFTQLVEVPLYATALRSRGWLPAIAIAFGASLITHPLLWLVFPALPFSWCTAVLVAELVVIVAEALYLRAWRTPRALRWSLLANTASAGLGLLSRAAFGGP